MYDDMDPGFNPIKINKLNKDLLEATRTLSDREARFLVDAYYMMQDQRIRAENQLRAMHDTEEPHEVLDWLFKESKSLENQTKRALTQFSHNSPLGVWAMSNKGIGPVLSAGLLAHIDLRIAVTAGCIWRYAGMDPTSKWLGGERAGELISGTKDVEEMLDILSTALNIKKENLRNRVLVRDKPLNRENIKRAASLRPWNASFKVLCWKIGESFVKVKGYDDAYYGHIYEERKAYEIAKNEKGEYADFAAEQLRTKSYGKTTEAYKHYIEGRLPPGHIHARCKRYAVKIFLSHFHQVGYELILNKPAPVPWVIEHGGHVHRMSVPNFISKFNQ